MVHHQRENGRNSLVLLLWRSLLAPVTAFLEYGEHIYRLTYQ
ncbi:MAG: hypothetical protein V7L01_10705 [Nostoc sp.]